MGTAKLNFYRDEPLFGLDIGHTTLKVMQLDTRKPKNPMVLGYGVSSSFSTNAIQNGVISDYDELGKVFYELFKKKLVGEINTKRVSCTIPTSHTFSRQIKLPSMDDHEEIAEAVKLEVEQYVPMPADKLYVDFEVTNHTEQQTDVLMVATPKTIIDSYMKFFETVGLEPVALEPTMHASARVFSIVDPAHNLPSIIIDFGAISIDVALFDQSMIVNSTVSGGSDNLTNLIAKKLSMIPSEAYYVKNQEGLNPGPHQAAIKEVAEPLLANLVREMQKTQRYYNQRNTNAARKIEQIILMGGGANLPGLGEYLTKELGLPATPLDPWQAIDFGLLPPPDELERAIYLTVVGEALLKPSEVAV